jgi:alpha-tubulin suppressor-like RCC1 family protein
MKTALSLFATSSIFAAALLLACGDDNEAGPIEPAPDAAGSDAASPPDDASASVEDASDGGAPDAGRDPRPPFDAAVPEPTCAVTPCIRRIFGNEQNYCAMASDGVVRCWGNPSALGSFVDSSHANAGATPVVVSGLDGIVDIGIAPDRMCAVTADGKVYCFGSASQTPAEVPNVASAKNVSAGPARACAVLESGDVWCWGDSSWVGNGAGLLDLGGNKAVSTCIRDWAPGFALAENGTLYSWGSTGEVLGRTSAISPDLTPAPVVGLPPILKVSSSNSHACALAKDGRLYCWGKGGDNGALGLGYFRHEFFPVEVLFDGPAWPTQIATAQSHSCARMSDGSLTCWSKYNIYGELGRQPDYGVFVPTKVEPLNKKVLEVAVGENSTCARLEDGSVQCWGANGSGQLGQGARDNSRHPAPVTVVFP